VSLCFANQATTSDSNQVTPYEAHLGRRTFAALDGLRAIAIITVVWHHTAASAFEHPLSGRGFLGVDLFFVISGFLIVTLLLRERQRTQTISLPKFFVRRMLRIFPLYYAFLAVLALYALTIGKHGSQATELLNDLPIAALYLSNWWAVHGLLEMTWSLAAEEQFYLAWPWVERFVPRIAWPLIIVVLGLSWAMALGTWPNLPGLVKETTFAPILLGVLLAHLLHRQRGFKTMMTLVGHRFTPVLLLLLLLAMSAWPSFTGLPRMTTQVLMMLWLASVVVREDHVLMPLLRMQWLVRIGTLSYGIYILHLLCRHVAQAGLVRVVGASSPGLLFVTTLVISVGVAHLSYVGFEKRFLALKHGFNS
jgi:peptidoglycan/LPS O-acetylase OafA/YrhL